MTIGKRGFQPKCSTCPKRVKKRANGQPLASSFLFLGRIWKKMAPMEKSRYESWQSYIKIHRSLKLGD